MNRLFQQGYSVKFCFKLDNIENETHEIIKSVYCDDVEGQSRTFKEHKLFCEAREQVGDDQRSRRTSTTKYDENLLKEKNLLNSDR